MGFHFEFAHDLRPQIEHVHLARKHQATCQRRTHGSQSHITDDQLVRLGRRDRGRDLRQLRAAGGLDPADGLRDEPVEKIWR